LLKSKTALIILLITSVITIFIIQKKDVIFQEGNPIPLALAISKMIVQDKDIVVIWENPNEYLVKQGEFEPFIKIMQKDGWDHLGKEDTESYLMFKKGNTTQSISYNSYTRFYTIIKSDIFSEQTTK